MFISHISKHFKSLEDRIPPFGVPVTKHILSHDENYLISVIDFQGIAFEALEDDVLHNHFLDINQIIAQLAKQYGTRLALWTYIVHEKINFEQTYQFGNKFTRQFAEGYLKRFKEKKYFENKFYLALCFKFDDSLSDGIRNLQEILDLTQKTLISYAPKLLSLYDELSESGKAHLKSLLEDYKIEDMTAQEFCAVIRYEPEKRLCQYDSYDRLIEIYKILRESGEIVSFDEITEFLGLLVNGKRLKMPVTAERAHLTLPRSEIHCFYNYIQAQYHDDTEAFFTTYDLKGLPGKTSRGQFKQILSLPFEFVLTQSFYCQPMHISQKLIQDQINRLGSVDDKAKHQIEELEVAQALLASGDLAFGDYHGALIVKGDTYKQAIDHGTTAISTLLSSSGTVWVKAKLSNLMTWLSQLPTYKIRPRSYPKPSTTLASTFSMYNYSTGKTHGNPIGDGSALMPLVTKANSLYSFNTHYSRPGENNTGEKIAGHMLVLGATGVGKTATQCAILSFLERFNPGLFALDKDNGMEIFFRSLRSVYFPLKAGEDTGLAPMQLPDTPINREFLYQLITVCVKDQDGKVTAEEERQIKIAVDTVYTLRREYRCFSRLLESIPYGGENGLRVRLGRWCHADNGRFAWVFDNTKSILNLDTLEQVRRLGFDVTDFLKKNYEPTEPILSYLFHIKSLMQKRGGLMATIIEECWLPAMYPTTQGYILNILKTGRKLEEFAMLISQSPADIVKSPIFEAMIEQTPTKIFLPNPWAQYEGNYQLCNLTFKEFEALKRLNEQSRTFLIKQGNQSCFGVLDLYGMDDELAILSGSTDNVALLHEIMQEIGSENPDDWMPIFQKRRKGKR